jgi:dTDP-glucose 4,6-dehydratase
MLLPCHLPDRDLLGKEAIRTSNVERRTMASVAKPSDSSTSGTNPIASKVASEFAGGGCSSRPWIMVTGGLGFIGSHVVEHLSSLGSFQILVVDCKTYAVQPASLKAVQALESVQIRQYDITEQAAMKSLFDEFEFTMVLHFAAESHVDRSFGNSMSFTHTNVIGTHSLLEAWRCSRHRDSLQAFVHVSTDEVHGSIEKDLDDPDRIKHVLLQPTNPYAASKAAAEMFIMAYHKSDGLPYVITRGNNVYGPRQHPEKLVPRTITRLLAGDKAQVHGQGTQTRTFVYVKDVARMFGAIVQHPEDAKDASVLLLGCRDKERTIVSVVEDCCDAVGVTPSDGIEVVEDPRRFNDTRYVAGISSFFSKHDALPLVAWKEGLAMTAESFQCAE